MNKNMSKVDFLNKISAGQDTEWLKEAMWRRENAAWLKKSMDIANDVLDELHRQKTSKSDFARAMGVSPQRVTTLLSGREKMNLETISKMEEALHVTLVRTGAKAEEGVSEKHRHAASFMLPLVHYATESLKSADNIFVNSKRGKVELNCI